MKNKPDINIIGKRRKSSNIRDKVDFMMFFLFFFYSLIFNSDYTNTNFLQICGIYHTRYKDLREYWTSGFE